MDLIINGSARSFPPEDSPGTVLRLLQLLEIDAKKVVVEINGTIVKSGSWDKHSLQDDDKIEIVAFVGGG